MSYVNIHHIKVVFISYTTTIIPIILLFMEVPLNKMLVSKSKEIKLKILRSLKSMKFWWTNGSFIHDSLDGLRSVVTLCGFVY